MSTVSSTLVETIKELQNLTSLSKFALAGGTNLALRYNHRKSIDIDLFCDHIIGINGFKAIKNELTELYDETLKSAEFPCEIDNQYIFLRAFVLKPNGITVKIEFLQNMKLTQQIETLNGIKLISTHDIGLFKLVSASSRSAKKDIYDLNYITQSIDIINLFNALEEKKKKFNSESDKTIFDLDGEYCPIKNPELLIKFDKQKSRISRPNHSNDVIDILEGGKTWISSSIEWKMKIRKLYRHLGIDYPNHL